MMSSDFWQKTEAQLAEIPLDISFSHDAFYSQPEWDVYRLSYSTTGGHRLFAWLSIPKDVAPGPVPALLRMPDYASVHDIIYTPLRHKAVVMNATHRGQRNSDGTYRASYPGLLTDGLEDEDSWVMLGAFADALRSLDVLLAQNLCEIGQVALWGVGLGGSLALSLASHRSRVGVRGGGHTDALGAPLGSRTRVGIPFGRNRRLSPCSSGAKG